MADDNVVSIGGASGQVFHNQRLNADIIESLEVLLELARDGQLDALVAMAVRTNGATVPALLGASRDTLAATSLLNFKALQNAVE